MKYKLLKDLPYAKAGEVFERVTHKSEDGLSDYDYLEIRKREADGEDETRFGIQYNYFLNNFDEWFEEITDSIHWKPRWGDKYYHIDYLGYVHLTNWEDDDADNNRLALGFIYPTEEACRKAKERKLAKVRLQRTSSFKPDFENGKGGWIVFYDHECKTLAIFKIGCYDSGEPVHYATREEAEKSIEENERDWKIYFGIKEWE